MSRMTNEQKAHHARAIAEAVGTEDPQALGSAVAGAVVANNPKLAHYEEFLAAALGLTLKRFYARGEDGEPSRLSWLSRLWPW